MTIPQEDITHVEEKKEEKIVENHTNNDAKITELEKALKDTNDKLKRVAADYQNLLRRSQTELDDAKKYSASKFAKEMIEAVDVLKLAITHTNEKDIESNVQAKNLFDGLTSSVKLVEKGFEDNKITKMSVKAGDTFDFNLHNAIMTEQSDIEKGKICDVLKDGYKIHDKVLIHAIVKVSSGK